MDCVKNNGTYAVILVWPLGAWTGPAARVAGTLTLSLPHAGKASLLEQGAAKLMHVAAATPALVTILSMLLYCAVWVGRCVLVQCDGPVWRSIQFL